MINLKCTKCGAVHAETPDHLKAHLYDVFPCDPGCGAQLKPKPEDALALLSGASPGKTLTVPMYELPKG